MSAGATSCTLKYLVRGVAHSRESSQDLKTELNDMLPNATAITVLPVVQGLSVEVEVSNIAPFSRTSFEPYVAEHVLPDAVRIRCQILDPPQVQLLKSHFN